jgi:hypothetical protein
VAPSRAAGGQVRIAYAIAASWDFRKRNGVSRTTVRIAYAIAASWDFRKRNGVSRTTVRIAYAIAASWESSLASKGGWVES